MRVYIDIETKPTDDAAVIAKIREAIRPPATYKKPESIAAWYETEGAKAADEAISRTALDGSLGAVIAIGSCRDDDDSPTVLVRKLDEPEAAFIRRWFDLIEGWLSESGIQDPAGRPVFEDRPHFIGHNCAFDLHFLWHRCAVLALRPPFYLPGPNSRPGKDYNCSMMAWAGYRERISLQNLCLALNLPDPKSDGGGAQAFEWWHQGDLDRVARYCAGDVEAVRQIWERIAPLLGSQSA